MSVAIGTVKEFKQSKEGVGAVMAKLILDWRVAHLQVRSGVGGDHLGPTTATVPHARPQSHHTRGRPGRSPTTPGHSPIWAQSHHSLASAALV